MNKFYTDSIALTYTNVEAAKRWWTDSFDCTVEKVPDDWDNRLNSDVALKFPGDKQPSILLSARAEVEEAGFDRPSPIASVIFCDSLRKAHEQLTTRGVLAGPIQDGGDMQLFEIRDLEGNLIEVCKEG